MKLIIDTDAKTLQLDDLVVPLYSREAFEHVSREWLRLGWNAKYTYTFSWLGRPIIQLPEDMVRIQEVIARIQPDVIVETGVAHGGSLIYYASLCHALGKGLVVGVDVEIRPHNRRAIEAHPLARYVTLVEGDSVSSAVVSKVKQSIGPGQSVLVLLDSNHSLEHVQAELEAYHGLVTPGSYIVATDGIMELVHDVPRGKPEWRGNNPAEAARRFAAAHPEFVLEKPAWPFNESELSQAVTHWPSAYLRRR